MKGIYCSGDECCFASEMCEFGSILEVGLKTSGRSTGDRPLPRGHRGLGVSCLLIAYLLQNFTLSTSIVHADIATV